MIFRQQTTCPGCGEAVVVRITIDSTELLHFYVPCPACALPIRGSMKGHGPGSFRLELEGRHSDEEGLVPVVTVNPFFPSSPSAKDLSDPGSGMIFTIDLLAGTQERMLSLLHLGGEIREANELIPSIRRLLEYYESENYVQTAKYLKDHEDIDVPADSALPVLHSQVFQIWQGWISSYVAGASDPEGAAAAVRQVNKWHLAGLKHEGYKEALQEAAAHNPAGTLVRGLVGATKTLARSAPAWSSGYLRNAADTDQSIWEDFTLFQDEFISLRDAYHRTFEACCSSVWPMLLMRNCAVNGDPANFAGVTYRKPNDKRLYKIDSLQQFHKLSNAYKLEVIRGLPGMKGCFDQLDNKLRNEIGHASAHHDLQKALIVSDRRFSMPYFDLVAQTISLFAPLLCCVTLCRHVEIASRIAALRPPAHPD